MNPTTDTPRSDKAEFDSRIHGNFASQRLADFARQLERELAAAKSQIEKLKDHAIHRRICKIIPCTCGLSKLLEKIKP